MEPVALVWTAVLGSTAILSYKLLRFLLADADLSVLSRSMPASDAFAGKVVWLVGASQGLGETVANYFVAHGARVVLSARRHAELERVAERCGGDKVAATVALDIKGDFTELSAAADAAFGCFGGAGVDILVPLVGASQRSAAEETSPEVDREMFELNALGPIRLAKAALPRMLDAGAGHIAVVSSMAGVVPSPGQSTYAATKHALQGFFKSLAAEVADRGVGVSVICPGPVAADPNRPRRKVFGADGLVDASDEGSAKSRVAPERVAELIGAAVHHRIPEVWVAKHPVLALAYAMRLAPALGWAVLRRVGPKRVRAMREGRSGYDVSGIMSQPDEQRSSGLRQRQATER
eukprot:CAMPEP_0177594506 /NCGR_PEP_ID=MMETSP0419_2-20121207/9819_1 /TAXON_ID=582737 /ORGANISM="Tetraselmis sp., Strain GSL018" /LENGTH=349 /DNA_ID=CAMNT_0019085823 /DNA_START=207 /DNA_END=1253 /DNA_ORIENTATION=-